MLMDQMRVYAVKLADLLPDRFLFKQNPTWWFIRDQELSVLDMRSNTEEWQAKANIWGFLGPLCHEYKVKRIIASDEECIEEATFKALLEAVGASLVDA